jgi:hypothetical protein
VGDNNAEGKKMSMKKAPQNSAHIPRQSHQCRLAILFFGYLEFYEEENVSIFHRPSILDSGGQQKWECNQCTSAGGLVFISFSASATNETMTPFLMQHGVHIIAIFRFLVSFNGIECFIKYFSLFRVPMPYPNVSADRNILVL